MGPIRLSVKQLSNDGTGIVHPAHEANNHTNLLIICAPGFVYNDIHKCKITSCHSPTSFQFCLVDYLVYILTNTCPNTVCAGC